MNDEVQIDANIDGDGRPTAEVNVVFLPSGRRGIFAAGTSVLTVARKLGVDIDSVCGGRAVCGRCQVSIGVGEYAKFRITSREDHLTGLSELEKRYGRVRV